MVLSSGPPAVSLLPGQRSHLSFPFHPFAGREVRFRGHRARGQCDGEFFPAHPSNFTGQPRRSRASDMLEGSNRSDSNLHRPVGASATGRRP